MNPARGNHRLTIKAGIALLLLSLVSLWPSTGRAQCSPCGSCCGARVGCAGICVCTSDKQTPITVDHITNSFNQHRKWMIETYFKDSQKGQQGQRDTIPGILEAMMLMTETLTSNSMQRVMTIGAMLDAKHQLETQRLFQELTARAHKDYHPSEGMCEIGTQVRSLSSSERRSDLVLTTFANRMLDRELLSGDVLSVEDGPVSDKRSRLKHFIDTYCNKKDNGGGLENLCKNSKAKKERYNKDIDYTNTIDMPLTLKVDFLDGAATKTEDEEDVFALSANLFASTVPPQIRETHLVKGTEPNEKGRNALMNLRALAAKRSVAQNSLAAIVSQKAEGTPEAQPFVYAALKELGGDKLDLEEIKKYLGEKPSYFAQMEMLTKKIYQNPVFFTELYDKPANVMRKEVTIEAIQLMQKRDIYRSLLRNEAVFSTILETALMEEQEKVKSKIDPLNQNAD